MGRVASPHGVRGALHVAPQSADAAALLAHREWWLRRAGGEWIAHTLLAGRERKGTLIVELSGIESRDAAAHWRGADVGVPRASLPPLLSDEHYQGDLVGMAVVNREGSVLGVVAGFIESGAHPIVRIASAAGQERLIPWVPRYIDRVDAEARRIDVDWRADYEGA